MTLVLCPTSWSRHPVLQAGLAHLRDHLDREGESTTSGVTTDLTFTPLSATHLMWAFGKKFLRAQVS